MAARGRRTILHVTAGILAAGAMTFAVQAPASAGIFERIFGGLRQAIEAPARAPGNIHDFADPFAGMRTAPSRQADAGPASAYCVRTSDGFYFPVQAHAGVSAAEACRAFCPASQTRLYSGGGIDKAAASDGSRYADLDTAFLYRKELVVGSTCNGRDHFGLARVDVNTDPTLRPGDIVATRNGLVAVTAMKNKVAEFTPVENDRAIPQSTREKLAGMKIMPTAIGVDAPNAMMSQAARPRDDNRSAQLAR
jgi:Protein of unknown function (DUF2865)